MNFCKQIVNVSLSHAKGNAANQDLQQSRQRVRGGRRRFSELSAKDDDMRQLLFPSPRPPSPWEAPSLREGGAVFIIARGLRPLASPPRACLPLRGRWHGVAVTDEGHRITRLSAPSDHHRIPAGRRPKIVGRGLAPAASLSEIKTTWIWFGIRTP